MKKKFKNLESGQKVWSYQFGKGTVFMVNREKVYVEFTDVSVSPPKTQTITYNFTGRIADRDRMPDLYLKKPVIIQKKRLNHLTDQAFENGNHKGKWSGYEEARRIHKLELSANITLNKKINKEDLEKIFDHPDEVEAVMEAIESKTLDWLPYSIVLVLLTNQLITL